jgi:hypothetical protein
METTLREVPIGPERDAYLPLSVVGTSNSGIGPLAYYQKAGFRLGWIERDFFNAARGYPDEFFENGIRIRDMVWMDLDLTALPPSPSPSSARAGTP